LFIGGIIDGITYGDDRLDAGKYGEGGRETMELLLKIVKAERDVRDLDRQRQYLELFELQMRLRDLPMLPRIRGVK